MTTALLYHRAMTRTLVTGARPCTIHESSVTGARPCASHEGSVTGTTRFYITRRSHEGPTSLQIVRSFSGVYDLFHKSVRGHEFIVQTLCMQACVPNVFRVPQVFRFPDVKKINYTENCATADFPLLGSTSWKFRSIPSQNYGS